MVRYPAAASVLQGAKNYDTPLFVLRTWESHLKKILADDALTSFPPRP